MSVLNQCEGKMEIEHSDAALNRVVAHWRNELRLDQGVEVPDLRILKGFLRTLNFVIKKQK